jgi:hypothetical protein
MESSSPTPNLVPSAKSTSQAKLVPNKVDTKLEETFEDQIDEPSVEITKTIKSNFIIEPSKFQNKEISSNSFDRKPKKDANDERSPKLIFE